MSEPRNVTETPERYALYRLCECTACHGAGRVTFEEEDEHTQTFGIKRCPDCRGEGRTRDLVATCATPEAIGVALVTLGREGEWEGCPIGILDTEGEKGQRWLVRPWSPSARNVSDAARTLAKSKNLKWEEKT
jgi:hypothetical protein